MILTKRKQDTPRKKRLFQLWFSRITLGVFLTPSWIPYSNADTEDRYEDRYKDTCIAVSANLNNTDFSDGEVCKKIQKMIQDQKAAGEYNKDDSLTFPKSCNNAEFTNSRGKPRGSIALRDPQLIKLWRDHCDAAYDDLEAANKQSTLTYVYTGVAVVCGAACAATLANAGFASTLGTACTGAGVVAGLTDALLTKNYLGAVLGLGTAAVGYYASTASESAAAMAAAPSALGAAHATAAGPSSGRVVPAGFDGGGAEKSAASVGVGIAGNGDFGGGARSLGSLNSNGMAGTSAATATESGRRVRSLPHRSVIDDSIFEANRARIINSGNGPTGIGPLSEGTLMSAGFHLERNKLPMKDYFVCTECADLSNHGFTRQAQGISLSDAGVGDGWYYIYKKNPDFSAIYDADTGAYSRGPSPQGTSGSETRGMSRISEPSTPTPPLSESSGQPLKVEEKLHQEGADTTITQVETNTTPHSPQDTNESPPHANSTGTSNPTTPASQTAGSPAPSSSRGETPQLAQKATDEGAKQAQAAAEQQRKINAVLYCMTALTAAAQAYSKHQAKKADEKAADNELDLVDQLKSQVQQNDASK